MKKYKFNEIEYELTTNYKDGFDFDEITNRWTEYYDFYDYVLGDWSYGKLRLKGFCEKENKNFKPINDIKTTDKYLKELCSYECRYFILKKVK